MTTTLRPAEPLWRGTGGERARAYQVCVNGRPVGEVRLRAEDTTAWLRVLRIDEAERHRGRGAVAALAAEEVARGWGCSRLLAGPSEGAVPARRLLTALGYVERPAAEGDAVGLLAPEEPAADGSATAARPLTVWEKSLL